MTNVAREFVLLDANPDEIEMGQLKVRPLTLKVDGEAVRVASDMNGHRHLLVPSAGHSVRPDAGAVGISISVHPMVTAGGTVEFVDIHCQLPHLSGVFVRFAQDISDRLTEDAQDPPATCRAALTEWRAFLRTAGRPLGRETIEGLIGELSILEKLSGDQVAAAVEAWVGPEQALHDFTSDGRHLEVKATASLDGKTVSISNLDQLDPDGTDLTLAVVHLAEEPSAPGIDMILDRLIALGAPRHALLAKVSRAGYVPGSGADGDFRFKVRSIRVWIVGDGFPGLRRSHIPAHRLKGIERVRYDLNLDTAPEPMAEDAADQHLSQWIDAGGAN
jgi:hypothetical protein